MSEPPVTITASRHGASAFCHLCDWRITLSSDSTRRTSAVQLATRAWSKHWHRAHTERDVHLAGEVAL